MGLIIEYPELLGAREEWRMIPFGMSFTFLIWWYTIAVSAFAKVRMGKTLTDSISDIVISYIVWIFTPTAFVA